MKNRNVILEEIGITNEMMLVYQALLDSGFSTAGKISKKTGMKRSYVYKLLDLLENKFLVKKDKKVNKVTFYYPESPSLLNKLVEEQEQKMLTDKIIVEKSMSSMLSKFNILEGKPNISFFEGVSGVKELYENILLEKSDIKLIRSVKDTKNTQLEKLLNDQKKKQRELNIKIKVVGPVGIANEGTNLKQLIDKDKENLVERRVLTKDEFSNESQIIIYGNKVAITSYDEHIITTIIESFAIQKTFENIFEILWEKGKKMY